MQPKGFWSYARFDDDHFDGALTELRKRVAGEVSMLLGHDISIFQDTEGPRTGDRWAKTLREGVTSATFLLCRF
jgi:F-box protein 11